MEALKAQFPADNFTLLAIVLALPLLGAFVNGVFGKRLGNEGVRFMALSAIGGAFVASVFTFLLLPHSHDTAAPSRVTWTAWQWLTISGRMQQSIPIDVAFSADALTATMMLVVTGVGFLIHLYATEYMAKDPGFARFFAYLNLFCFAMLVLIMADNLALLFVGWEGVGLCSYLLIGFWYTDDKNASAGKKAFIVNRIGDFGLLLAMAMIIYYAGTVRWDGIQASAGALLTPVKVWPIGSLSAETVPSVVAKLIIPDKPVMVYASTLIALALFLGCAGKSAQIPLYVWLPDAMAGPTPVSALIHAATMVTAGVYLVARMSAVFLLSPAAMAVVAVTGVLTALLAASIGLFQNDLKKVLAYSTVSQLGFMFIGVGVGAFAAGIFHVFTHAFFKACLFLGAGSVIHAMHARIHATDKSQDMRFMGGLREFMPKTRWTFLIACCAIAGLPLMSGFWSKDEILWEAFSSSLAVPETSRNLPMWSWPPWLGQTIYWAGIVAATMTAFYMFRAYFLTFHGRFKGWKIVKGWQPPHHDHDHHGDHDVEEKKPIEGPAPKESPPAMTIPLIILAAFAVFAGFLNAEPIHIAPLGHRLSEVFAHATRVVQEREAAKGMLLYMMLPGIAAFLAGTAGAIYVYWNQRGAPERKFARQWPTLYGLIYDKWRIDELYDITVVGMVDALADIFAMADKWIIDGILAKLTAAIVGFAGTVMRAFQTGRVQVYAAAMVIGLVGVGSFLTTPRASVTVDDRNLKVNGEVVISASQGLGYTYEWDATLMPHVEGPQPPEFKLTLSPGETKDVTLRVRDAFGMQASETIKLARPPSRRMTETPSVSPVRPGVPPRTIPSGTIPGERIHELLPGARPGGAQ